MTSNPAVSRSIPGIPEQYATRMAFFVAGLGTAAWAPLVPYAKARLVLDDGTLGLLLLCLGAGSILSMPVAGLVAARYGCRLVISLAMVVLCLILPGLAVISHTPTFIIALLLFGASIGIIDVVINIQAVIVEKAAGKTMMSGFHGLFSLGGIVGASGVAGLLWLGLSPLQAMLAVCTIVLVALLTLGKHLLPYATEQQGPTFVMPHGIILFIGFLCFVCFLAEGAMLDWSAVFLTSVRNLDPAYAGLGYAAFAMTMTIGRLSGDYLVRILGGVTTLAVGGLIAAGGFIVCVTIPATSAAFLGFAMIGLGASNVVPVLYSATGRQTVMPPHLAVAAVTTFGYSGILSGPALIGFIAHGTSLQTAFLCVAAMLLLLPAFCRIAAR